MNSVRIVPVAQIVIILHILIFYLIGCTGSQNQKKDDQDAVIERTDSSQFFDGKTLEGWEITNFGPQGPVYVSGGKIVLGMGDGCTGITWKGEFPTNNYKVTLEAMRVNGNDFFCGMTFPVDNDPCTLIVGGWGGAVVGLSSIDGMDASDNETTTLMNFEKERWYEICLIVKEDTIKVIIDKIVVIDFAIADKSLSIRPEVGLSMPFGIATWCTTAAIRNIQVDNIE